MATNYPTSLDSLTNPGSSDLLSSGHASQHANLNDAMEAVQTKLGTTSTPASLPAGAVLGKASGTGIKVDTSSATWGWRDIIGDVSVRGVGGTDPSLNVYRSPIRQFQFTVNDEVFIVYHVPHDYVPASDLYIHAHWSHASASVSSGSVTWGFDVSLAKGFDQAAFSAPINTTVPQTASTTQYQHMIAEVQLSAASPSASQLDSDNIEVDSLILVRCYLSANTMNGTPEPFLHSVDLHYQSTNMATKAKTGPAFYT